MTRGGELALAVTMGYVLGRRRRMRWALALGTAAAAGRLSSGRGSLVGRLSQLSASPGVGRLLEAGRPLVSAGGAAARTAVGGRIDSAADRLQQTAQRLRGPGRQDADTDTDTGTDRDTDTPRPGKRRASERDSSRAEERDAERSYGDENTADDDRFADDEYDDRESDDGRESDDDEDRGEDRGADEREYDQGGRGRRAGSPRPPVRRRGR